MCFCWSAKPRAGGVPLASLLGEDLYFIRGIGMMERFLLLEVSNIIRTYELIRQQTGGYFNIFCIAKIDQLEVTVCRVLHDLLNPYGSHYQGNVFLKEFVDVLGLRFTELDYETVKVYREYVLDDARRIDLYIETANYRIPIEVKIHAVDQTKQCQDYFDAVKATKLVYVTKEGQSPSLRSLGTLSLEHVLCLSFKEHIVEWLERCLMLQQVVKIASIREVLLQFMDAIKSFTNQLGDEEMNEVTQLISSNSEHMKSALLIEQGVYESRVALLKRLFTCIEERIALNKIQTNEDYAFRDYENLKKYYRSNAKNRILPGLHYLYQENVIEGCDIWFSIEIHEHLYAGFYLRGEQGKEYVTIEQIQQLLPHIAAINRENLYLHWRYLALNDGEKGPSFAYAGIEQSYLSLFDDVYFERYVDDCLTIIEQLYGEVILTVV